MGGSLPFRSGVVVSLRPLSVCHGSMWLVPALFPSLSLSFPVCANLQLGWNFLLLPDCPSPYFGLLVYWFLWLLFSTRVTYLRDGVTPAGSWTGCPRSERRFRISIWVRYAGLFLAGHPASVCGYLSAMSRCVAWWSSMCPYRWVTLSSLQGSSRSLVRGLGCLSYPTLFFCWPGLVPRSVAQLCALLLLVPFFRVSLSLLCAPLAVGQLPDSPN